MSVVSVYRTFYWMENRLAGQTGHIWEAKEEKARCIKATTSRGPLLPPVEDQQRRDARYHIKNQFCLCGIHGYFSPNYLSFVAVGAQIPHRMTGSVIARVRLGGLVDIHSMGARGEYGLIEEAWCDDDIAGAVAERYGIPVNQSEFEKQPRVEPILTEDAKIVALSPMFNDMPTAVALKGSFGITVGPLGGRAAGQAFGQAMSFQQYTGMVAGPKAPPASSLGPLITAPSVTPGMIGPPPPPWWGPQLVHSLQNAKLAGANKPGLMPPPVPPGTNCSCGVYTRITTRSPRTPLCPAVSGGGCLCGAHLPGGRGVLGSWKCPTCGKRELYSSDHVWCSGPPPKSVLKAIGIDTANSKPGIITRIKKALSRRGSKA